MKAKWMKDPPDAFMARGINEKVVALFICFFLLLLTFHGYEICVYIVMVLN